MPYPYSWAPDKVVPTSVSQISIRKPGRVLAALTGPITLENGVISFTTTYSGTFRIEITKNHEFYAGIYYINTYSAPGTLKTPDYFEYSGHYEANPVYYPNTYSWIVGAVAEFVDQTPPANEPKFVSTFVSMTGPSMLDTEVNITARATRSLSGGSGLSIASTAIVARSGSLSTTGSGTVTTSRLPRMSRTATPNGSGTLTAARIARFSRAVPMTGSGTLTATGTMSTNITPNIANIWQAPQQVDSFLSSNPELQPLADQPTAKWINTQADANSIASIVPQLNGKTLLLCIYAIPGRDDGLYSAGGFPDRASYITFINTIKTNLGNTPTIISFEPDALGHAAAFEPVKKAERVETLRQAVAILATIPSAETYIDASMWLSTEVQRDMLISVDVHRIAGFTVNTSAYNLQNACYTYANGVVASLATAGIPNKKYIVDSSRNGIGPLTEADRPTASPWLDANLPWCNPPARRTGLNPGTVAAQPSCRATLWIKNPGESDGTFPTLAESTYYGVNAPAAGVFWVQQGRDILGLPIVSTPPPTLSNISASLDSGLGPYTYSSDAVTIVTGRARIPASTDYNTLGTPPDYILKGSSIFARVYAVTGGAASATQTYVAMVVESETLGTRLVVMINSKTNQITFGNEVSYYDATATTITYDPVNHAWIRIRDNNTGTLFMETSPTKATWTIRKQFATPSWATAQTSTSQFVAYSDVAGGYAEIDNINL